MQAISLLTTDNDRNNGKTELRHSNTQENIIIIIIIIMQRKITSNA